MAQPGFAFDDIYHYLHQENLSFHLFVYFSLFFFIEYFMYLHFICYPLSQFSLRNLCLTSALPLFLWGGLPSLPPTPTSPPWHSPIPEPWGIKPLQDQGLLLLLMPDNAILYYICSWSPGTLLVFCLVGDLVPWSSGGSGWLILSFFLWGCKPLQLLHSFL